MEPQVLDDATVVDLARIAGIPLSDTEAAPRIAAGASAAIAAVRSACHDTLFDHEPSEFLATLEALADPGSGTAAGVADPSAGKP